MFFFVAQTVTCAELDPEVGRLYYWHPCTHPGVLTVRSRWVRGHPITGCLEVFDKLIDMAEINFLCVHKKLRSKRLAPVLIKAGTTGL